tara:strand:- start:267 stop:1085 length:819 start_codon:yes stop_codon:yes gene_type:complete
MELATIGYYTFCIKTMESMMRLRTKILLPLLSTVLFATSASAITISLEDLVNGSSIQVGDKLFDSWVVGSNIVENDNTSRTSVDLNNIMVTGDNSDPFNPGLDFAVLNDALTITQEGTFGANLSLAFTFQLTVDNQLESWKDISLIAEFIGGSSPGFNNRTAHVHEFLYNTLGGVELPFDELDSKYVNDDDGNPALVDQSGELTSVFFTPRVSGFVLKDIDLTTELNGETVGISSFRQTFSQVTVPEPSTLAIFGLGLMGLASRRLNKAKLN